MAQRQCNILLVVSFCLTAGVILTTMNEVEMTTLESVVMIHRHGDRNPVGVGPKDPHKDPSEWSGGLGQLTKSGKLRMYYLGLRTRLRYSDFLSDNIDEIYVRAADMDRCIASAELMLSALYRPPVNSSSRWNPRLNWQPIPIHTVPAEVDALLETKAACPRIREELARMEKTDVVKDLYLSIHPLLELIKRDLGLEAKAFEQIFWFYSDLKCYNESGKSLPHWYNSSNQLLLEKASVEVASLFTSSELLKKLQSGPILEEIYSKLVNPNYTDSENIGHVRKFYEYSTHDTQLINLLATLDVWDHKLPGYSSTLYFELHQDPSNLNEYVKLFQLSSLTTEAKELELDCGQSKGEPCMIGQFRDLVKSLQLQDWAATCRV